MGFPVCEKLLGYAAYQGVICTQQAGRQDGHRSSNGTTNKQQQQAISFKSLAGGAKADQALQRCACRTAPLL